MKLIHGYDGSCKPVSNAGYGAWNKTFSVGVFQIIPKASGNGTKRGPVLVRVKGRTSKPQPVYDKAREIVDLLDRGEYSGPKNVTVKL